MHFQNLKYPSFSAKRLSMLQPSCVLALFAYEIVKMKVVYYSTKGGVMNDWLITLVINLQVLSHTIYNLVDTKGK